MALRALQGPTGGGSPVGGGGTSSPSTIPRWTGPSTLGDSGLIDNGTAIYTTTRNVGFGTATPGAILHTLGTGTTTGIFATTSANAWVELRRSTSTTLGYIGTGAGLVTGGAAADLAFRCESGNLLFSTGATERARIDSSGVLTTTDLATYSLSGTTASVASGGTSAALFTPAASSEYIVYIQATSNTGVMAHAMVLQNGAASGALVSVVGSVLCTINNAAGALTITNNSGSAETFRWRALKLRSLV